MTVRDSCFSSLNKSGRRLSPLDKRLPVSVRAEEGEDRNDAAVVGGRVSKVEFEEDLPDVALDCAGAEEQVLTDRVVGVSFGHQRQRAIPRSCGCV
jgi:hypothetical protein